MAIEGVTILRNWCSKKSHINLILSCYLHILEWYEEVWIRIIALEKALFLREGHTWWFLYPFSSWWRFISNSPNVLHHAIYEGLCVYHWMIPMTGSRKLISTFSNLIYSDTKRIDKSCVFKKMSTRYEKQEKWICHWIEVNSFFIFLSMYIYCALIMNSYHRKSRKSVIHGVQLLK